MTTASEVIAARLRDAGCTHAFGIPGGEVLALMDALHKAGIEVVLSKHENCAGFMGEGVYHANGAPAILFATIGPGIANAVNVIANAWQDRVPMIVLTGCVPALEQHTYTHQVFDHVKMCETVAKAAYRVEPCTAGVVIDKALAIACEGRPGPVVLDVPIDVQRMEHDDWHTPRRAMPVATVPAEGADLKNARSWLAEAERPIMIAGVDVLTQRSEAQVEAFCRQHSVPLITTYKAKGIIPEDDDLALGGAGLSPNSDAVLMPLLETSDLILLAGYDPIEMRIGWRDPWPSGARVVDISAESNTHYMHQGAINIVGDVGATLDVIGRDAGEKRTWPGGEIDEARHTLRDLGRTDEEWGPAAVIDVCREVLPRDTVITVDSGAHRIVLSQIWQSYLPRGVLQSTALCTMGCAVPLAMGRKIAEPDRPVVAFIGDAGLEMFLGELATARDLKLGIPIVVFVDEQLGLIELKQRGNQMENLAVEFGATDFPAVAKALGGEGVWCRYRESLSVALKQALERDTFTVIAAVIGGQAYDGRI